MYSRSRARAIRIDHSFVIWLSLVIALLLAGCDDECVLWDDCDPPAAPRGVYSVTGDECVKLYWLHNTEDDVEGYNVYYAYRERGPYRKMACVSSNFYVDRDVDNSETYYYAVTALDVCGNESDLSYDTVFDTPRPEGFGWVLRNANGSRWDESGFDFSKYDTYSGGIQEYNRPSTDIYFVADDAGYAMFAGFDEEPIGVTLIQDAGYIDLEDVDYAPGCRLY
jgi:hypothetical protein